MGLVEKIEDLQGILVAQATWEPTVKKNYSGLNEDYVRLRREVVSGTAKSDLPNFVRRCRSLKQFWGFIKLKFNTYQERRQFIWDAFAPLLNELESKARSPSDSSISSALDDLEVAHVSEAWSKALKRREKDPDGAITLARTLLESTCKLILEADDVSYSSAVKLPKLYYKTAEQLNLAPSQHEKELFKAILGNCQTVVGKLGEIRNEYGDAHGQGKQTYRPSPRHAELAVNLAGAMATFLVRTWRNRR